MDVRSKGDRVSAGGGDVTFTVLYQFATYSGTRTVPAEDEDHALARAWVVMAYESCRVLRSEP